jgi:hypothetical protein
VVAGQGATTLLQTGTVCKVMQRSLLRARSQSNHQRRNQQSGLQTISSLRLTGEPSCKDEARIGQKNGLVRQWARRGTRPRQPADQRYENAYLFGAICPARGKGAALALPFANTEAMQLHVDEIARNVAPGAHAVLIFDRAGWHTTPELKMPPNITPIWLPSRAPELNPVENVWQYLRQNWLSNTVFETYDAIIDAACDAWNKLAAQPDVIRSIGLRKWAHVGQTL